MRGVTNVKDYLTNTGIDGSYGGEIELVAASLGLGVCFVIHCHHYYFLLHHESVKPTVENLHHLHFRKHPNNELLNHYESLVLSNKYHHKTIASNPEVRAVLNRNVLDRFQK